MFVKENSMTDPVPFEEATGPIDVTLKNDMMFHLVMARSPKTLKGLVCSLKGLDPSAVRDVKITNPIDYSMYATKEIILDVKVQLNDNEIIDIELQMYLAKTWQLRTLLYLCRTFDSLNESENYSLLKPTTFIAIMNDPMFPDHPEFYSRYSLLNTKNFQPYSSYLNLNVLYLNMTEMATQEDIDNNLVYWAKVFKATDWEELRKLCSENDTFKEGAQVMYKSNIQSQEKTYMEAHEKYMLDKNTLEYEMRMMSEEYANLEAKTNALAAKTNALAAKNNSLEAENNSLTAEVSSLNAENAHLIALLKKHGISDEQIASNTQD